MPSHASRSPILASPSAFLWGCVLNLAEADELARELYGGHPAAAALLIQAVHGTKAEAVAAKRALKILVPSADKVEIPKRLRCLWEGAKSALAELDRYTASDFSDRVSTGIPQLDRRLRGGLRGGQMTLLGAPTGSGKTAFVAQVATVAARQGRGGVLFVSPEMSLESLAEREIIRESGRALWGRNPWKPDATRDDCVREHILASRRITDEKLPIYCLEDLDITMSDVETAALDLAKDGLALVVIDYAQYVAGDARDTPRYLQVGEVAERSVALALKLNVPVLIASQVNVAKDGSRRAYTFRESQILEHKAHTVLVLDVQWQTLESGERHVERADFVCTKNRGAATFTLQVNYEPELYRITECVTRETYGRPRLPAMAEDKTVRDFRDVSAWLPGERD